MYNVTINLKQGSVGGWTHFRLVEEQGLYGPYLCYLCEDFY